MADNGASAERPRCRVLQLFHSLGVGGAETWLLALLKWFREHGDSLPVALEMDIVLTSGVPAVFDEQVRALGANLFYLPYGARRLVGVSRGFRRLLAERGASGL